MRGTRENMHTGEEPKVSLMVELAMVLLMMISQFMVNRRTLALAHTHTHTHEFWMNKFSVGLHSPDVTFDCLGICSTPSRFLPNWSRRFSCRQLDDLDPRSNEFRVRNFENHKLSDGGGVRVEEEGGRGDEWTRNERNELETDNSGKCPERAAHQKDVRSPGCTQHDQCTSTHLAGLRSNGHAHSFVFDKMNLKSSGHRLTTPFLSPSTSSSSLLASSTTPSPKLVVFLHTKRPLQECNQACCASDVDLKCRS